MAFMADTRVTPLEIAGLLSSSYQDESLCSTAGLVALSGEVMLEEGSESNSLLLSFARLAVSHSHDTPPEANPDLWTLAQAADFLDVSRKQLLDLIRQGDVRYIQRGLRIRIHREELERYRERTTP
jgi:excisionase family DNA binding protein